MVEIHTALLTLPKAEYEFEQQTQVLGTYLCRSDSVAISVIRLTIVRTCASVQMIHFSYGSQNVAVVLYSLFLKKLPPSEKKGVLNLIRTEKKMILLKEQIFYCDILRKEHKQLFCFN